MGKGSRRRQPQVDYVEFAKNWEAIFGKGKEEMPRAREPRKYGVKKPK